MPAATRENDAPENRGPGDLDQLRRQVEGYRRRLERLLGERSEYLRVSAHQMKSPVSTILFSVETLLGDYAGRLNSKQLRVVESIRNSARNLQSLIMDILELERFRSGDIEREEVDVADISVAAVDALRDRIGEKDIHFTSDIPRKVLVVSGNRVGLQHALRNLLENAVKYSHEGGEVRFVLSYEEAGGGVSALIEDHGIGIPADEREKVFDEFYRASNARRFDRNGTGFGMAIVRQVVELCGGSLSLESGENQGTTVTVTFSLLRVEDAPRRAMEGAGGRRIVVVGGVAAGPKAASRARRLDPEARITLFERSNFLAYAGCALPFYISGRLSSRRELFKSFTGRENAAQFFRDVKGIEIRNLTEVTAVDRENRTVRYRDLTTGREGNEPYDVLVLATGSSPVIPDIPGRDLGNVLSLHGVADSESIKLALANMAREVIVLGGGNIAVETAEALTVYGARVTILERQPEILPFLDREMGALVRRHLAYHGVRVLTGVTVQAFLGEEREGMVRAVRVDGQELPADLVVVATGFRPETTLAREAGLELGPTGAVAVNELLQTSDERIYAAGDCTEVRHAVSGKPFYLPLGSIANRQGRVAGSNAAGRRQRFAPVNGTIIIRVFGLRCGKTGLTEREARDHGLDPVSVYVPVHDRDEFVPGSEMINIKLIADRSTRKVLGAQIVGMGDAAKRIDVVSSVITAGGDVDDLAAVDLGYGPSYSQAIDSIQRAAHVMDNKMSGLFTGITADLALDRIQEKTNCVCIDVRSPREFEEERIPGVESIPLESLRARLDEVPRDRSILLVCDTGARSYQASRILEANGFRNASILEGGLRMWPFQIRRE
jgi:NADPH-dependent 2,4-dienoyl-CoA reductase/sulfur reductase-like enzyme/rhodanese-related sulfurtransferase/two-component sensor histidine kinase